MAHGVGDFRQRRAGDGEQIDPDTHEGLGDDEKAGFGKQVVDVCHAPESGVLDRQHGEVGLARADRLDGVLEGAAGHGLHLGVSLVAGLVRIGTRLALKGNASGHFLSVSVPHRDLRQVRSFGRANYTLRLRSGSG